MQSLLLIKNFKLFISFILNFILSNLIELDPNLFQIVKYIFDKLDDDNDGLISGQKIDLNDIDTRILELIQNVLYDMEEQKKSLDINEFIAELEKYRLMHQLLEANLK